MSDSAGYCPRCGGDARNPVKDCPSCNGFAASRPPQITADDISSYFVHDDGSVWRVVTYAASPTATLECVYGRASVTDVVKPRVGGCVGAPIFASFRKLVPEEAT